MPIKKTPRTLTKHSKFSKFAKTYERILKTNKDVAKQLTKLTANLTKRITSKNFKSGKGTSRAKYNKLANDIRTNRLIIPQLRQATRLLNQINKEELKQAQIKKKELNQANGTIRRNAFKKVMAVQKNNAKTYKNTWNAYKKYRVVNQKLINLRKK